MSTQDKWIEKLTNDLENYRGSKTLFFSSCGLRCITQWYLKHSRPIIGRKSINWIEPVAIGLLLLSYYDLSYINYRDNGVNYPFYSQWRDWALVTNSLGSASSMLRWKLPGKKRKCVGGIEPGWRSDCTGNCLLFLKYLSDLAVLFIDLPSDKCNIPSLSLCYQIAGLLK